MPAFPLLAGATGSLYSSLATYFESLLLTPGLYILFLSGISSVLGAAAFFAPPLTGFSGFVLGGSYYLRFGEVLSLSLLFLLFTWGFAGIYSLAFLEAAVGGCLLFNGCLLSS